MACSWRSSSRNSWDTVSTYAYHKSSSALFHTHAVRNNNKFITLVSTALLHAGQQQQQQQRIQMRIEPWLWLSRRQYSNSSSSRSSSSKRDQYSDRDLQLHFDTNTSWPTILIKIIFPPDLHSSLLQFFQLADSLNGYRSSYSYDDLFQSGVINDPYGVSAVMLFRDLQNPLLVKYAFDPNAFVGGAKTAFEVVNLAIASKEFHRYAGGVIKQSSDNDLLSEVLSSRLYLACLESSIFFREKGIEIETNRVHVSKCILKSIKTAIISATTTNNDDQSSTSDLATAALTDISGPTPVVDPAPTKKSTAYPPGSVIATVDVMFQSEEEFVHRQRTVDSTGEPTELVSKRYKTSTWTFQGCISGQTELHWKIIAFDGLG